MNVTKSPWSIMIPVALATVATLSDTPKIPATIQYESSKLWGIDTNNQFVYYKDIAGKARSFKTLNDIQKLANDWNGYSALPIPLKVIELSRNIIMMLSHQPEIYPTGRKTVQMQYELADRSYLEFEIYENKIDVLEVPKRDYDNASEYSIKTNQLYKVCDIVKRFVYV